MPDWVHHESMIRSTICASGVVLGVAGLLLAGQRYDVLIRNGLIHDGLGGEPFPGAVAVDGDNIAAVGSLPEATGRLEIDAAGLAVAPGFINMLSWSNESLIHDGRALSAVLQGVTLEVMGEGVSMGPWNDRMKAEERDPGEDGFEIAWTTLGEYLQYLEKRGVSVNVASFVGTGTVRRHELGHEARKPTAEELERMRALVRQAMEEGAMGVSSALIYTPGAFADTEELVALAEVAAEYGGMYISHIRGEGDHLLEAVEEFLTIVRRAKVRGEIYHIKAGWGNWEKFDEMVRRIESARAEGLAVTADMYPYHASATGLDSVMPAWVREGGHQAWVERLKDPAVRERVRAEMDLPGAVGPDRAGAGTRVLLTGFRNPALRPLAGKTLAEVAAARGRSPEDTAMDLVIEDDSRVGAVFFSMSEDNVRKAIRLPWVSFCSDAAAMAAEGRFLRFTPHPRAYGAFARLLGRYVRDERLIPLAEAVRRLTSFPAENLRIARRGRLAPGYFADVVVFDPARIRDHADFAAPHRYATGVHHVLVNGRVVIRDGRHTGAFPGRVVHGPGRRP